MKSRIILLIAVGLLVSSLQGTHPKVGDDQTEKEVLKLELPKPMFVGTPKNIRTPNLERITGKSRKPFFVPKGTTLLSLNKTVNGSDSEPIIGEMEFVTDGEKSGEDGYYVEYGPGKQYVQIDLEDSFPIHVILVWHYHSQARVYYDVVIQVSDDPDFIQGVKTVFNNDHDNSSKLGLGQDLHYVETAEGKLIDAKGIRARFIRFYSNGNSTNDLNHYVEVEVFGRDAT